jgi:hypothetical protein
LNGERIFVRFKGRTLGPFNAERTRELYRRGQITKLHELSSDGVSWVKADQFPLFSSEFPSGSRTELGSSDGFGLSSESDYALAPEPLLATQPSYLQPPVATAAPVLRPRRQAAKNDYEGSDGERPEYWHPLDGVIEAIREAFPPSISQTIATGTGNLGNYLLYVAQALLLVLGVFAAVRTDSLIIFAIFFGAAVGLLVLQYMAQKLLVASDVAVRSNTAFVASYAITDCITMVLIAATTGGFLFYLWLTIVSGTAITGLAAFLLLVLGGYFTISIVHPASLYIAADPRTSLGETLLGIYAFLMRSGLRSSAVLYFSAIVASLGLLGANLALLATNASDYADSNTEDFIQYSSFFAGSILAAASIPTIIYLATLLSYLTIDVLLAILSIPRKLSGNTGGPSSLDN